MNESEIKKRLKAAEQRIAILEERLKRNAAPPANPWAKRREYPAGITVIENGIARIT